jgi:hypothetical protein
MRPHRSFDEKCVRVKVGNAGAAASPPRRRRPVKMPAMAGAENDRDKEIDKALPNCNLVVFG